MEDLHGQFTFFHAWNAQVLGDCFESATLRLAIFGKGYEGVSVQSFLWDHCWYQSFVTIKDCACGEGKAKEFSSSCFIYAPALLMLTLDRVVSESKIVDRSPRVH